MSLCKDCIHYKVCEEWAKDVSDEWNVDAISQTCHLFDSLKKYKPVGKTKKILWFDVNDVVQLTFEELVKENTCVCCGKEIPEGRQVCPNCEKKGDDKK
jgi:hypothetical protein